MHTDTLYVQGTYMHICVRTHTKHTPLRRRQEADPPPVHTHIPQPCHAGAGSSWDFPCQEAGRAGGLPGPFGSSPKSSGGTEPTQHLLPCLRSHRVPFLLSSQDCSPLSPLSLFTQLSLAYPPAFVLQSMQGRKARGGQELYSGTGQELQTKPQPGPPPTSS